MTAARMPRLLAVSVYAAMGYAAMMRFRRIGRAALLGLLIAAGTVAQAQSGPPDEALRYTRTTDRSYQDVFEDVEFAIVEHNFRVTGNNRIGAAIAERLTEPFPRSDVIHFCNLEYAREFLQRSPDFLIHMPCKVVLRQQDGQVVVSTPLLPAADDPELQVWIERVNVILKDVVDYAIDG